MPKCPMCKGDLKINDDDNYFCNECQEHIPKKFASDDKIPCCDPLNPCK